MRTYKPFRNNVLVEKLKTKKAIVTMNDTTGKWIRLKVISVGPDVIENIKPGMIVLAENMFEAVDLLENNIGLISSQYIHTQEIEKESN